MDTQKLAHAECRRQKLIRETELYLVDPHNQPWARVDSPRHFSSLLLRRSHALKQDARAA